MRFFSVAFDTLDWVKQGSYQPDNVSATCVLRFEYPFYILCQRTYFPMKMTNIKGSDTGNISTFSAVMGFELTLTTKDSVKHKLEKTNNVSAT